MYLHGSLFHVGLPSFHIISLVLFSSRLLSSLPSSLSIFLLCIFVFFFLPRSAFSLWPIIYFSLSLSQTSDLIFLFFCLFPFSPPPPLPLPQTYFSLTSLHQFICSVIWVFVNKNKNGKMRKVKWKKNKVKTVKLKTHNRNFPFSASGLF